MSGSQAFEHGSLMPNKTAPAMWSLDVIPKQTKVWKGLSARPELVTSYRCLLDGPTRSVPISYVVTDEDALRLTGSQVHLGETSTEFWSQETAIEAGVEAFRMVSWSGDLLVPGGYRDEEWPIAGPEHVLRDAAVLKERGLLTSWLQVLSRYRQFAPGVRRGVQYATVRLENGRYVVVSVGGVL